MVYAHERRSRSCTARWLISSGVPRGQTPVAARATGKWQWWRIVTNSVVSFRSELIAATKSNARGSNSPPAGFAGCSIDPMKNSCGSHGAQRPRLKPAITQRRSRVQKRAWDCKHHGGCTGLGTGAAFAALAQRESSWIQVEAADLPAVAGRIRRIWQWPTSIRCAAGCITASGGGSSTASASSATSSTVNAVFERFACSSGRWITA